MPSLGNEHRQYDNAFKCLANQRLNALTQVRRHEFKESGFNAHSGRLRANQRNNTLQR